MCGVVRNSWNCVSFVDLYLDLRDNFQYNQDMANELCLEIAPRYIIYLNPRIYDKTLIMRLVGFSLLITV